MRLLLGTRHVVSQARSAGRHGRYQQNHNHGRGPISEAKREWSAAQMDQGSDASGFRTVAQKANTLALSAVLIALVGGLGVSYPNIDYLIIDHRLCRPVYQITQYKISYFFA